MKPRTIWSLFDFYILSMAMDATRKTKSNRTESDAEAALEAFYNANRDDLNGKALFKYYEDLTKTSTAFSRISDMINLDKHPELGRYFKQFGDVYKTQYQNIAKQFDRDQSGAVLHNKKNYELLEQFANAIANEIKEQLRKEGFWEDPTLKSLTPEQKESFEQSLVSVWIHRITGNEFKKTSQSFGEAREKSQKEYNEKRNSIRESTALNIEEKNKALNALREDQIDKIDNINKELRKSTAIERFISESAIRVYRFGAEKTLELKIKSGGTEPEFTLQQPLIKEPIVEKGIGTKIVKEGMGTMIFKRLFSKETLKNLLAHAKDQPAAKHLDTPKKPTREDQLIGTVKEKLSNLKDNVKEGVSKIKRRF
jgi:hypothetical protein